MAGLGTQFAALPDLLALLKRRSSAGMNPSMAGITCVLEGDLLEDPESLFVGHRLRNGRNNLGSPWTCKATHDRLLLPKAPWSVAVNRVLDPLVESLRIAWKIPRWRWALGIAGVSDALGFGVAPIPPVQWLLDAVTAGTLLAVLGFRWPLLVALAVEVVPGLQVLPAWTLVVAVLARTYAATSHPAVPAAEGKSPHERP